MLLLSGMGSALACQENPPEPPPPLASSELPVAPPFALGARAASNSAGAPAISSEHGSEEHGLEHDSAPDQEELGEEHDPDAGREPPAFQAVPDGPNEVPL